MTDPMAMRAEEAEAALRKIAGNPDLALALQVHHGDFEGVANSMAYSSPAQTLGLEADILALKAAPQKFFADLARAARSPGYGDHHRQFVANLLLRAQEAGLYVPETP